MSRFIAVSYSSVISGNSSNSFVRRLSCAFLYSSMMFLLGESALLGEISEHFASIKLKLISTYQWINCLLSYLCDSYSLSLNRVIFLWLEWRLIWKSCHQLYETQCNMLPNATAFIGHERAVMFRLFVFCHLFFKTKIVVYFLLTVDNVEKETKNMEFALQEIKTRSINNKVWWSWLLHLQLYGCYFCKSEWFAIST